ncbi:MAG TPA: TolC family protein, partial [Opitutaceae bacterium]|nr:TolC family protein [Opitutaceae bacterium]
MILLIILPRLLRRTIAGFGVVLSLMVAVAPAKADLDSSMALPEKIFPILVPILENAARQGPQALRARLDEQMAEEMILVARSRRLPSIGGGGTFSIAQEKRLDRPDLAAAEKLTYNFGLTQPIYHWGSLRAGHEVGKISERIAENNYAEACRLLLIEVRTLYLRMVVARADVERTRNLMRLAREDLTTAESRIQSGALAPGEIHGIRFRVLDAEIGFEKSEEEFRFAKATLERLAGIAPLADADVPSIVPNVPFDPTSIASLLESYVGRNGAESDF